MLKFVGLLLLFASFSLGGSLLVGCERARIEREEELLLLIRSIRREAAYFRRPLEEIFASFSAKRLEKDGFLSTLRERGLEEALRHHSTLFGYDAFTQEHLLDFAAHLGKLPLEDQLASCDRLSELLEVHNAGAKENFPKKNKLYKTLGITLGIGAVILFL